MGLDIHICTDPLDEDTEFKYYRSWYALQNWMQTTTGQPCQDDVAVEITPRMVDTLLAAIQTAITTRNPPEIDEFARLCQDKFAAGQRVYYRASY